MMQILLYIATLVMMVIIMPGMLFNTFGIHNDYSLLGTTAADALGFVEAKHLMMIGRILGGLLVSWQGLWTPTIEVLSWWRIVGFVFTLIAVGLMVRFIYRRGFDKSLIPWALISLIALPCVNVGFLWSVHVLPGALNLIVGLAAYLLFNRSLEGYRIKPSFNALMCFLGGMTLIFISLWIYFPTACVFLLMGYLKVLWFREGEKPLRLWLRDIVFFSFAVIIYVVIDRCVIYQWVINTTAVVNIDPEYQMSLTRLPWHKWRLLVDALVVSWQGQWQGYQSLALWMCIAEGVTFFLLMIYGGCRRLDFWYRLFIALLGAGVLLIITQLPSILSVGINELKGYRVIIVPMLAMMFLKIWMIDSLLRQMPARMFQPIATAWLVVIMATALLTVKITVNRHQAELLALERAVIYLHGDAKVRTLDIIPARLPNDMLGGRVLSEYNYMMSLEQHVRPAFNALCFKYQLLPYRYRLNIVGKQSIVPIGPTRLIVNLQESMR